MGFAAGAKRKASFGFKASAAFTVSKPIAPLTFRAGVAPGDCPATSRRTVSPTTVRVLCKIDHFSFADRCITRNQGQETYDFRTATCQQLSRESFHNPICDSGIFVSIPISILLPENSLVSLIR